LNRNVVSRRACLAAAAASAATIALTRNVLAALPPGDYVDMHTHLGQTWNTTEPLTAEEITIRIMNAKGLEAGDARLRATIRIQAERHR